MDHKTYLKFLAQVASESSGSFDADCIQIYFWWNAEKAIMSFSVLMEGSDQSMFGGRGGSKKLKWSNDRPYFEIRDQEVFLTQDIGGIPTYLELKTLVKDFIETYAEFNDQSMGSFAQLFK